MNNSYPRPSVYCDPISERTENGIPKDQAILLGNSIVCDGYVSGKTTAIFTHFHDDHTWNFKSALRNCHNILLTEFTYSALKALQKFPERPTIQKLSYNSSFTTNAGEIVELINANHVSGSCQVFVTMEDTGEKILYSGDFSFPEIVTPKADYLVLDGTHGIPLYDFDTDKESILRRIFDEVCTQIEKNRPVEILANRGTMQDIMAQLEKTKKGEFIAKDIPFLAESKDVDLTNAIKHIYDEKIRDIEVSTNSRLNELYNDEKKPYVRFAIPGRSSLQHERAQIIQADVNPNFKNNGPYWSDKNGKIYACLAAHAGYGNILKYVKAVNPKSVIVDGTRTNSENSKSLANAISKEFGITCYTDNCKP